MMLTGRLLAAASLIPKGSRIADIGTDHGYLPVYAYEQGLISGAVAVDVVPGPLRAAKAHVAAAGLQHAIACRLGNGLTGLAPNEVDGAVFCGMGGALMVTLLEASPAIWKKLKFLILQPQGHAGRLRRYLYDQGWHIEDEKILIDDGRFYEMLRAVPGQQEALPDWVYEIGPINWERKDALLARKIDLLIDKLTHICEGLSKSSTDKSADIAALQQEIRTWEERKWQLQ